MWTVESVTAAAEDLPGEEYGHLFKVCILLKYSPAARPFLKVPELGAPFAVNFDHPFVETPELPAAPLKTPEPPAAPFAASAGHPFVETPELQWLEQIYFKDHRNQTCWEWSGDVYINNPNSRTFHAWRTRYSAAYDTAMGQSEPAFLLRGVVELRDANGNPIRITHLPGQYIPQSRAEKAEKIRNLIRRIECQLYVEIHDRPSINISQHQNNWPDVQKERLLLFDCGVGGKRVQASQYLRVGGSLPEIWKREFQMFWLRTNLPMGNYKQEFPPRLYTLDWQNVNYWNPYPGDFY
jgi:hypothetical protein